MGSLMQKATYLPVLPHRATFWPGWMENLRSFRARCGGGVATSDVACCSLLLHDVSVVYKRFELNLLVRGRDAVDLDVPGFRPLFGRLDILTVQVFRADLLRKGLDTRNCTDRGLQLGVETDE